MNDSSHLCKYDVTCGVLPFNTRNWRMEAKGSQGQGLQENLSDEGPGRRYIKMFYGGPRGMTQSLGVALLLKMTWIKFPAPTWPLQIVCNSNFRGSVSFFWPSQALYACDT